MISEKIKPHHLERKALLYVRQSSAHQVLHNRESSGLQYAMRDRLTALGWSEIGFGLMRRCQKKWSTRASSAQHFLPACEGLRVAPRRQDSDPAAAGSRN